MFKGSIVAIVTPFTKDRVDEAKLKDLVEFQIKNGTNGIVPCGTTGESPTLSHEEHDRVIEVCIQAANKRVPVIAGTGSNSTAEAVRLTKHAAKAGADGALVVVPYYNKPTQRGLYLHFKAIADSVNIPIIFYNIPGRTGVNATPETIAKLAHDCKNIIGIKEATGSLEQAEMVRKLCPGDFITLSGDDVLTLPLMGIGGSGVISVLANIVPDRVSEIVNAFLEGDIKESQKLHYHLLPLMKAMFIETNPIPVKTAMGLMGLCSSEVRMPLCEMSEANVTKLKSVLKDYGLIKK